MMLRTWIVLILLLSLSNDWAFAQQSAGTLTREQSDIERSRNMEKRIHVTSPTPVEEPVVGGAAAPAADAVKVRVNNIVVEGTSLLTELEIRRAVAPYEGRSLNMTDMQEVADRVSEAYRTKGYVTSRAYIPVQSIKDQTLIIKTVEVKTGTVEVQGNKYFKADRLKRDLNIVPNGYFDFAKLQRSLMYINEHPDRVAKAVLIPGKEPGTTDVVIQVADQRPMHVGFEYNNYASRFVNRNQYALTFEHNNLFGYDDLLFLKAQVSDESRLTMQQLRYLFPLTSRLDVGIYALNSHLHLGKEFSDSKAIGDAHLYGVFSSYKLYRTKSTDLRFNLGFDYKSLRNKFLGSQTSRDELRVIRAGFDLDFEDRYGRNIITANIDSGIPELWGGSMTKDPQASRAGAGGRFDKGDFTFFRLMPTPFHTSLLWKNIGQFSNNVLPSSEQFQMGGALSVRGYPAGEFSGDSGIYSALELSLPVYGLSKGIKVPFTKDEKLYEDLRFVLFYDLATSYLNNPIVGEEHHKTLRGYGLGIRLNVKENVTLRVEVGFPHGRKPSDGDSAHTWVEFTCKY